MARTASFVLWFALSALLMPSAGAEEVTVVTYNVENMFDVYDDPYTGDEGTAVKTRQEVELIAAAIAATDADVVVFQELENEYMLEGMVQTFLADQGYAYIAAQRTNSGRGINMGVISRYPIARLASHRFLEFENPQAPDRVWRFARDAMQITLDINGQRVEVFNVHLKSNRDGAGDPHSIFKRTAEAIMVKSLIRDILTDEPDAYVLLMGDCNSNYYVDERQDRPWPATEHLREAEADGSHLLIDVHTDLSREDRITIPGSDRYPPATFDYIYASPALAAHYVEGSARVVSDPELTGGSDHRPVVASFDLGE